MPYQEKEIEKRYYSIGEVSEQLKLTASQIRYWESEFDALKPQKDRRGNRLFTKEDMATIQLIHYLLKEKGYTIEGANTKLKTERKEAQRKMELTDSLNRIKAFLIELKEEL